MNISKTKKLTTIGMLCTLAYAAAVAVRIPLVLFLRYDPKDIIMSQVLWEVLDRPIEKT